MAIDNSSISGFNVSVKLSSNLDDDGSDSVGLGLRLQSSRSLPSKTMMMMPSSHHHYNDLYRPLYVAACDDDDNACGGTSCNNNNSGANEVVNVAVGPPVDGGAAVVVRTLEPFDTSSCTTAFKSPGKMAAKVEFPFTSAQWKDLETQAMIYKYMMASMPVPPHLLLPLTTNFRADPSTTSNGGNIYNWRCTNNKEIEPGRCKRTDGKKWRCSREVAPNQKYCKHHMHRGRPRSRKPVEVHVNNKKNNGNRKIRLNVSPRSHDAATIVAEANLEAQVSSCSSSHQMLGTKMVFPETNTTVFPETNTDVNLKAYASRDIQWVMEDKMVGVNRVIPQWPYLMDTKIGFASSEGLIYDGNTSLFEQDYEGDHALSLFCYKDVAEAGYDVQRTDECHFFLNSDLVSSAKQHQIDEHRGFIDAWSNDDSKTATTNGNDSSVSLSQGNHSPSSLILSMAMAAGNDAMDEEMAKLQADGCLDNKAKDSTWMSSTYWIPFAQGGPLVDVLHTGSVAAASNPASPYTGGYADSISPPATNVSSPTRVLYKAFSSQSDSSVCNSPIVSAPVASSEGVASQWLKWSAI